MALVLLACTVRAEIPEPVVSSQWDVSHTDHFTIINGHTAGYGRDIGRRLERMGLILTELYPGMRVAPPVKTIVYVLNAAQFSFFAGSPNAAAFFLPAENHNFLVVNAELAEAKTQSLNHEYTHLFMRTNFPGLPLWLHEGLAQYYGAVRVRGQRLDLGHRNDFAMYWLQRSGLKSMGLMFAMQPGAHAYTHGVQLGTTFYSQSWAMVQYLLVDEARAASLERVLDAVHAGASARKAFENEFPNSKTDALVLDLRDHLNRNWFEVKEFRAQGSLKPAWPSAQLLPRAEALRLLGRLLQALRRYDDGREIFVLAVAADSTNALVRAESGLLEELDGHQEQAEEHFAAAIRLAPENPDVWATAAYGALRRGLAASVERDGATEADSALALSRRRFDRVIELGRSDVLTEAGRGLTFVRSAAPPEQAVLAVERALTELPYRVDLGLGLLQLYMASDRRPDAEKLLEGRLTGILTPPQLSATRAYVEARFGPAEGDR